MKKIIKIQIVLLLCALVLISTITCVIAATIITSDDYVISVEEESGYTSLVGWNASGTLIVPNSVKKYYISEIGDFAFSDRDDITGVDMNSAYTLKRIGMMAFEGCTGMVDNLVIPNRVTDIGISAFEGCTDIESVTVHSGTKAIPAQMCYNCTSLSEVTLGYGIESIGRLAFANCSSLEKVIIPLTVRSIDALAFYNSPNTAIYCYTNSYAHQYALDKGFEFVLIDAPSPTEPTVTPTDEPTQEPTEPATEAPTDEPTETPSEVPTEVPTESVSFILGDADGDGIVTVLDATVIQRVLVMIMDDPDGMIELRASVDGDKLNITHATKIQRFLAEMEVPDPIGTEVTRIVPVHTQG